MSAADPHNASERRREPRRRTSGAITLEVGEPFQRTIEGHLLDVSSSGFRLSHHDADLLAGQRVNFRLRRSPGTYENGVALVAWRRILSDHIECGCHIENGE